MFASAAGLHKESMGRGVHRSVGAKEWRGLKGLLARGYSRHEVEEGGGWEMFFQRLRDLEVKADAASMDDID